MAKKPAKKAIVALADIPMMQPTARPKEDRARERRHAAEDALRTLTEAERHKSNPRVMADVRRLAAERAAHMAKIAKK